MPPGKFLKLGTLRLNLVGKMHTVMFICRDYVIVPTTLNIKQVKSLGGGGGGQ